jgi:hypothetical protein
MCLFRENGVLVGVGDVLNLVKLIQFMLSNLVLIICKTHHVKKWAPTVFIKNLQNGNKKVGEN